MKNENTHLNSLLYIISSKKRVISDELRAQLHFSYVMFHKKKKITDSVIHCNIMLLKEESVNEASVYVVMINLSVSAELIFLHNYPT